MIAIDMGCYSTKIVVGKSKKHHIEVEHAFTIQTPSEAYEDGNIQNIATYKKLIHSVLMDHKIKGKEIIFTMQSTATIAREIVVPFVKEDELTSMVQFEIEQYLPIRLEEYIVEYKVLEEFVEEDMKKLRILVAVLPKNIVENYLTLVAHLKLKPTALDIHSNVMAKIFKNKLTINNENYSLDKTVALIDLGHKYMNVIIIDKGVLRFNRLIHHGGKDLDTNIANAFNLSLLDAEKRKIEHANLEKSSEASTSSSMINEIIQSNIAIWIQEIQRIFQYYTSRHRGQQIHEIYLYGGCSSIKSLPSYIASIINIPTFKIHKMSNIKLKKETEKINIGNYLNAIAALKGR
jgi:type IV pilus assembly protein PilM